MEILSKFNTFNVPKGNKMYLSITQPFFQHSHFLYNNRLHGLKTLVSKWLLTRATFFEKRPCIKRNGNV